MAEHPATRFAAQAARAAGQLAEFLNPLRVFDDTGRRWPRDLTTAESAALLPPLRSAAGDLATCAEGIAAGAAFEGMPRDRLNEAGHLMMQAFVKIQEAESALGASGDQPPPQLAARDFPQEARRARPDSPAEPPPAPGTARPAARRPGTDPRHPRTP